MCCPQLRGHAPSYSGIPDRQKGVGKASSTGGRTGVPSGSSLRVSDSGPRLGHCRAQFRVADDRGSGDAGGQIPPTFRAGGRNSQGLLGPSALLLQLAWRKGPCIDDHSQPSVHCGHHVRSARKCGGPPSGGHTGPHVVRLSRNLSCHTRQRAHGAGRQATSSDTEIFGVLRKRAGRRIVAVHPPSTASSEPRCLEARYTIPVGKRGSEQFVSRLACLLETKQERYRSSSALVTATCRSRLLALPSKTR